MIDRFHHLFITPADFDASVAFYRDVLGWTVSETWGGKGLARGAVLSGGGVKVVIGERAGESTGDEGLGGTKPNMHLDIHNVDKRFDLIPKGQHVVRQPEETPWGTRWFVVKDPDGNLIAFEQLHGG
ncbi:MAG TPA: VOC family protein [Usitatibacter sp.]|nr:VOC family protein [Usitatibacter sp.]